jgi:short-subunit dehydrogenase involved in D-alanine esterification of teichoic acids
MTDLDGRCVLITGGTAGVGLEVGSRLTVDTPGTPRRASP